MEIKYRVIVDGKTVYRGRHIALALRIASMFRAYNFSDVKIVINLETTTTTF
jgi:hypothetical protein